MNNKVQKTGKSIEENAKDKQNEFMKNQLDSLLDSEKKGDLDPTKAEDCPAAEEMMTLVKEIGL